MAEVISDLTTTTAAAAYLRIHRGTLERYRLQGYPKIEYVQFGGRRGRVFYRKETLDNFLANNVFTSTSIAKSVDDNRA